MKSFQAILFLTISVFLNIAWAEGSGGELVGSEVKIKGTIVKQPCHINEDKNMEVDFGSVGINSIDGTAYLKKLEISIRCENGAKRVQLMLQGNVSQQGNYVLSTSETNLGIALYQADSSQIPLNTYFSFTGTSVFALSAVPVSTANTFTAGDEFTAIATLVAKYV